MKKLTAFLLAGILIFALCACGGQNQPTPADTTAPQSDNVDVINTTDPGTPISVPETSADITTSSLAVSENAAQEAALAAKLANYKVDIDLEGLNKNMITAQMTAIAQDSSSYLGKTIRVTGVYDKTYNEALDTYYNWVLGYDETGCCAAWGIEFYGDPVPDVIDSYTPISMVGTISTYDEEGTLYTFIDVSDFAM